MEWPHVFFNLAVAVALIGLGLLSDDVNAAEIRLIHATQTKEKKKEGNLGSHPSTE